jgi:hypothetical protein
MRRRFTCWRSSLLALGLRTPALCACRCVSVAIGGAGAWLARWRLTPQVYQGRIGGSSPLGFSPKASNVSASGSQSGQRCRAAWRVIRGRQRFLDRDKLHR